MFVISLSVEKVKGSQSLASRPSLFLGVKKMIKESEGKSGPSFILTNLQRWRERGNIEMLLSRVFIPFGETNEKYEGTQECAGTDKQRAPFFFLFPSVCHVEGKISTDFYVGKIKGCEENNNESPFNLSWVELRQIKRQEPSFFSAPNLCLCSLLFRMVNDKRKPAKSEKRKRRSPSFLKKVSRNRRKQKR